MTASFSAALREVAPTVLKFQEVTRTCAGSTSCHRPPIYPLIESRSSFQMTAIIRCTTALRRCIELLAEANPNILELLFSPQDCVQIVSKEMEQLIFARSIFVTRQCGD